MSRGYGTASAVSPAKLFHADQPEAQWRGYGGERCGHGRVAGEDEGRAGQERLDVEVGRALARAGHPTHVDARLGGGGVGCDPDQPGLSFFQGGERLPAGRRPDAPAPDPAFQRTIGMHDRPVPDARRGRRLGADDGDEGEGALAAREVPRPPQRLGAAGEEVGLPAEHQASTPFSRKAAHTLAGVIGISMWRTP